jgi:hypothetical protein
MSIITSIANLVDAAKLFISKEFLQIKALINKNLIFYDMTTSIFENIVKTG